MASDRWSAPPYLFITDDRGGHGPFLPDRFEKKCFTWDLGTGWEGSIFGRVEFMGLVQELENHSVMFPGDVLTIEMRVELSIGPRV